MTRAGFLLSGPLFAVLFPLSLAAQTYTIKTIAGGGLPINVPATSVNIGNQTWAATDRAGNLFLSLSSFNIVVELSSGGTLTLVAGNGTQGNSGDGGPATSARITAGPIAIDLPSGNLYIASGTRIRVISNGTINTVAGTDVYGSSGDGGPASQAVISYVTAITCDLFGNVYFAQQMYITDYPLDSASARVRQISGGIITTVAGNGTGGTAGDGGPAPEAELSRVLGLAVDGAGNLFICDSDNSRIRKVSGGIITTYAGSTRGMFNSGNGDGGAVANVPSLHPGLSPLLRRVTRSHSLGLIYR